MSQLEQEPEVQPLPGTDAAHEVETPESSRLISRRWMLLKAGFALNGLVGLALAVPIVRYLLAPWKKDSSYNSWVSLGAADAFPAGETRLAFYKNPGDEFVGRRNR